MRRIGRSTVRRAGELPPTLARSLASSLASALTSALVLATAAAAQAPDPRTVEVLRLRCLTGDQVSDLTLFGNGTLRLWEGEEGEAEMRLSELDPDGFDAYVRRLQAERLGGELAAPPSVEGLFTEQCALTLDVPEGPHGSATFGYFDSLSLELSRVVAIARELVVVARAKTQVDGLSPDYVPRGGDVLLHRDGTRYLVRGLTSDGRGVELIGLDQPLTLYVALESLADGFLGVEARDR